MNCSTLDFPVLHHLLELAQTLGPLSRWCHPTIWSSVDPFSSCLQSVPASGSFLRSQCFTSGGQVLELQLQRQFFQWIFKVDFLLDWLVWSPCSPRDSLEPCVTRQFKSLNSLAFSFLYIPTLTCTHDYWEKPSFDYMDLCHKVMSLLFNMLSRSVITFLPRSKHLLISSLQSPSAVILEPKKTKSVTVSIVSPSVCHEVMGLDAMTLLFWMLSYFS